MIQDLGLGRWDSAPNRNEGFGVRGLRFGFRIPGSGVQGSAFEFRVPDSGFQISKSGFGIRVQGFGLTMSVVLPAPEDPISAGLGFWVQGFSTWIDDPE